MSYIYIVWRCICAIVHRGCGHLFTWPQLGLEGKFLWYCLTSFFSGQYYMHKQLLFIVTFLPVHDTFIYPPHAAACQYQSPANHLIQREGRGRVGGSLPLFRSIFWTLILLLRETLIVQTLVASYCAEMSSKKSCSASKRVRGKSSFFTSLRADLRRLKFSDAHSHT